MGVQLTKMMRMAAAVLVLAATVAGPVHGVEPNEILKDPKLEQRARALSAELRCLVCQNQSIDDSNAPLARDLRLLVRERLTAGDSDEAVLDYIVARYGEFVLLRPPLGWHTLLLWLAPLLMLAIGVMLARFVIGRRPQTATPAAAGTALSEDEKSRLKRLLNDADET